MKTVTSHDGTTLAYDVYGSGPPLVFISGAICFRRFGPIIKDAKAFASAFTIYCYDRRGRGDSTDAATYSVDREVEDVEAIIEAAGGKAFVYGHSSGAVLALEAAHRYPDKVLGAALFDASYVHDAEEKREFAVLRDEIRVLLGEQKHAAALRRFLVTIGMPKAFVYLLPLMPGWGKMKALAPTLDYDIQLTADLPPLAKAAQIKVPVHLLYGGKSPPSIHSVAKALAKAIPGSSLEELKGQDHMADAKFVLPKLVAAFSRSNPHTA